ncbi:unnamed protein product, partial [Rotaria sp. Silwood1]
MGTIFKIDAIEQNGNMHMVKLTLNNDENNDIKQFIEFLRKEIDSTNTTVATLGNFLVYSNEYDKAETYYQMLLKELPPAHEDIPIIYNNIGLVYDLKGNHTRALQYYNKSLTLLDTMSQDNQSLLALNYNNLAAAYFAKKDYQTAILFYNMTLKVQTNPADLATTYNNFGELSREIGDFDSALKSFKTSLEMSLKVLPNCHPDLAATYSNIANVQLEMENYGEALINYKKALDIALISIANDNSCLLQLHNSIALIYFIQENYDEALNHFNKALKLELPHEFLSLSIIHSSIAETYHKKHEYDLALQSYDNCLNIQLNHLSSYLPDRATTYRNIALVYKSKKDSKQVISYYNKSLDIYKTIFPSKHPDLGSVYHDLAMTYHEIENYEAAIDALNNEQEYLPHDDPHIPMTYENLAINYDKIATSYYLNGNYQQAINTLEKSVQIQLQRIPNDDELILLIKNDIETMKAEMEEDRAK